MLYRIIGDCGGLWSATGNRRKRNRPMRTVRTVYGAYGEHASNRDWAQGISNENGMRVERRDAQVESEGGREAESMCSMGMWRARAPPSRPNHLTKAPTETALDPWGLALWACGNRDSLMFSD